jgi:hypothetical protein
MPVLTVTEFGKGRTLALQSDSTWRWGFAATPRRTTAMASDSDDAGRGDAYQRFWTQAIRWLVRDPSLRLLRVETSESEYRRGQPVRVELHAFGPDYQPSPQAEISLSLQRISGAAADTGSLQAAGLPRAVRTNEDGAASVDWADLPPGGYRVVARAVLGGRPAEDSEVFLVRGAGRELESPEADDRLLRLVSSATGGEARRYTGDLKGLRFLPPAVVRVNQHRDIELWQHFAVLAFATLCFGLNWGLRRRWGYA